MNGDRAYHVTFLIGLFCLMLLGAWMAGCKATSKSPASPATGEAISRAQAHVEVAQNHVSIVLPHTSGADWANLQTASASLASGVSDLVEAQRLNHLKDQQIAEVQAQVTTLKSKLASERDQWFGDKTHRLTEWVIGIGAAVFIGYEFLANWVGGGPILTAITSGGGFLMNLIGSAFTKLLGRKTA